MRTVQFFSFSLALLGAVSIAQGAAKTETKAKAPALPPNFINYSICDTKLTAPPKAPSYDVPLSPNEVAARIAGSDGQFGQASHIEILVDTGGSQGPYEKVQAEIVGGMVSRTVGQQKRPEQINVTRFDHEVHNTIKIDSRQSAYSFYVNSANFLKITLGGSNVTAALTFALRQIAEQPEPPKKSKIILVTDGMGGLDLQAIKLARAALPPTSSVQLEVVALESDRGSLYLRELDVEPGPDTFDSIRFSFYNP